MERVQNTTGRAALAHEWLASGSVDPSFGRSAAQPGALRCSAVRAAANRTDSRRTPSAERHTGRGTQASAASPASDVPSSAEARGTRVRRAAADQHFIGLS